MIRTVFSVCPRTGMCLGSFARSYPNQMQLPWVKTQSQSVGNGVATIVQNIAGKWGTLENGSGKTAASGHAADSSSLSAIFAGAALSLNKRPPQSQRGPCLLHTLPAGLVPRALRVPSDRECVPKDHSVRMNLIEIIIDIVQPGCPEVQYPWKSSSAVLFQKLISSCLSEYLLVS